MLLLVIGIVASAPLLARAAAPTPAARPLSCTKDRKKERKNIVKKEKERPTPVARRALRGPLQARATDLSCTTHPAPSTSDARAPASARVAATGRAAATLLACGADWMESFPVRVVDCRALRKRAAEGHTISPRQLYSHAAVLPHPPLACRRA